MATNPKPLPREVVARLLDKLGRHAQAEQALHEFLLAWPNAKNLAFVSQRLELQTKP